MGAVAPFPDSSRLSLVKPEPSCFSISWWSYDVLLGSSFVLPFGAQCHDDDESREHCTTPEAGDETVLSTSLPHSESVCGVCNASTNACMCCNCCKGCNTLNCSSEYLLTFAALYVHSKWFKLLIEVLCVPLIAK